MSDKPIALGVRVQAAGLYGCKANSDLSVVALPNIPEILSTNNGNAQKCTLVFSGSSIGDSLEVGLFDAQGNFVAIETVTTLPTNVALEGSPNGGWVIKTTGSPDFCVLSAGAGASQG